MRHLALPLLLGLASTLPSQNRRDTFTYPDGPKVPGWTQQVDTWKVEKGRIVTTGRTGFHFITHGGCSWASVGSARSRRPSRAACSHCPSPTIRSSWARSSGLPRSRSEVRNLAASVRSRTRTASCCKSSGSPSTTLSDSSDSRRARARARAAARAPTCSRLPARSSEIRELADTDRRELRCLRHERAVRSRGLKLYPAKSGTRTGPGSGTGRGAGTTGRK